MGTTRLSEQYKPQAWRMTDYYPDSYAKFMSALGIGIDYSDDDFDRYRDEFMADLGEHDRHIQAEAWLLGHAAGRDYQGDGWNADAHDPAEDNPYREEQL